MTLQHVPAGELHLDAAGDSLPERGQSNVKNATSGGDIMKELLTAVLSASIVGCATLTEDAMTPIALSFSDGANGNCNLQNKRGAWPTQIPTTISVRKSDDGLKYECETEDGRKAFGMIPSTMGGKIVASAVFIDFGITDAITDKHRQYPASFVIPVAKSPAAPAAPAPAVPVPAAPAPAADVTAPSGT